VELRPTPDGATNIEGLWVAGEVSGGIHGKNRLMGNSTLGTMVFGRRAGAAAAAYVESASAGERTFRHVEQFVEMLKGAGVDSSRRSPMLGKASLARMIDVW